MRKETLRMERVTCQAHGVIQLDEFNMNILAGEIMGLLPVNNHGLTSLLQLLKHNIPLHDGYVYYREKQINTWRKSKHQSNRIGLISNESHLVEGLTVADNIFVLRPEFNVQILRPSVLRKQLMPFLQGLDVYISADTYIEELTAFEKIVVDILKSVVAGYKLIVLHDVCTIISDEELSKVHNLLSHYTGLGISFLYIDVHIDELLKVCDKIALMSNGRIIKTMRSGDKTQDAFQSYTGGYSGNIKPRSGSSADAVLEIRNLKGRLFDELSFTAASGECVVLHADDVSAFGELLAIIGGETASQGGEILIDRRPAVRRYSEDISVIQELPTDTMLFKEMSYIDNLCFLIDRKLPEVWSSHSLREGIRREYSAILGPDVFDKRVDVLSETQKYELVYHRIALQRPKAVFCVQPFRRTDLELRMCISELIQMLLDKDIAVIILAVNMVDSLPLADKLIHIRKEKKMIK